MLKSGLFRDLSMSTCLPSYFVDPLAPTNVFSQNSSTPWPRPMSSYEKSTLPAWKLTIATASPSNDVERGQGVRKYSNTDIEWGQGVTSQWNIVSHCILKFFWYKIFYTSLFVYFLFNFPCWDRRSKLRPHKNALPYCGTIKNTQNSTRLLTLNYAW